MAKIEKFEDLQCWQLARQLTKMIYLLEGPITKDWGIQDQFRRAMMPGGRLQKGWRSR